VSDLRAYAIHCITQLSGPNCENARHSLIEADHAVIPYLVEACQVEQDSAIRALLVEIIWQHHVPATIELLSTALADPAPQVWKAALDGLVALGGATAVCALEAAKHEVLSGRQGGTIQIEWIDEALQQIREGPTA
jgi:HEAT repeat protein